MTSLHSSAVIDIGTRRELMVDDYLIAAMTRDAELRLHRPVPQEIALETDAPWEGNASGYVTVFQDDDRYLMYYRGWHFTYDSGSLVFSHPEVVCVAESSDGIRWSKPDLGLVEYDGSRHNNIILDARDDSSPAINFAPFKDPNPNAPAAERYKAFANNRGYKGLFALCSPDGIHWTQMHDEPVITKGYFDSQNLAFWDAERGEYRDYHRDFRHGRDIMTCVSPDFLNWSEPVFIDYNPTRIAELYTNQIKPYYRAPQGNRELRDSSGLSANSSRKRALMAPISPGWRLNLAQFLHQVGEGGRKLKVRDCPAAPPTCLSASPPATSNVPGRLPSRTCPNRSIAASAPTPKNATAPP